MMMRRGSVTKVILGFVCGAAMGGAGVFYWAERERGTPTTLPGHGDEEHADPCCGEHMAPVRAGGGHGEPEAKGVTLSGKAAKEAGIGTAEAAGGELEETLSLPAEIALNADKVARIVPRAAGIVRQANKVVGDEVRAGEVMAVLESREFAEAKAAFLAARQRLALAQANLQSTEQLHSEKIVPDLKVLTVRKEQADAEIDARAAEYRLHALGLLHEDCHKLADHDQDLLVYELRAPFAGTVIEKHCTLGEVLGNQSYAFVLADLSDVWVNLTVYPHDLARVKVGQTVRIATDGLKADGKVAYVSPAVSEATRTATARVVLPNPDRRWKPGMFVTATLVTGGGRVAVLVPSEAIQRFEGGPGVFIAAAGEFRPRPVKVGRSNATHTEILSGLEPGERYVTRGAFILKAELGKGAGGHEH